MCDLRCFAHLSQRCAGATAGRRPWPWKTGPLLPRRRQLCPAACHRVIRPPSFDAHVIICSASLARLDLTVPAARTRLILCGLSGELAWSWPTRRIPMYGAISSHCGGCVQAVRGYRPTTGEARPSLSQYGCYGGMEPAESARYRSCARQRAVTNLDKVGQL